MRAVWLLAGCVALCAELGRDPAKIFVEARSRLLETLNHLPKYTCMQSLYRSVYRRQLQWPSCDLPAPDEGEVRLESTDRLNLDIAVTSKGREIYSWAGASGPARSVHS